MFRRREDITPAKSAAASTADNRVTSVLGPGIAWKGAISGSGGVRIEGAFDGNIHMRGMLVVGETGRVTSEHVRAKKNTKLTFMMKLIHFWRAAISTMMK